MTKADLAERWRIARTRAGCSQEEIAVVLNIPRSGISAIETGDRDVSALELFAYATHLNYPIDYFLPLHGAYWKTRCRELEEKLDRIVTILKED